MLVRRFMQHDNDREMEIFEELVAEDDIDHVFEQTGRDALKSLFTMAFEGFPDWYEAIEDIIAEDDRVWVRVRATGTHTGDWDLLGVKLPATGKSVVLNMVFIWRVADGQIAEGWEVDDNPPSSRRSVSWTTPSSASRSRRSSSSTRGGTVW